MGIFSKTVGFLGYNAHKDIFNKTLGRSIKDDRIKFALSETVQKLLWACMVIGDKCFPILRDKRLLGTFHLSGLIVLIAACLVPSLLFVRAGRKLLDFRWVNERRQSQTIQYRQANNKHNTTTGETIHDKGHNDAEHDAGNGAEYSGPKERQTETASE